MNERVHPMPSRDDLVVLDALQRGLPLVARPFAAAADTLGRTEDEVLAVLRRARGAGWLSRVGPVFRPGRVGVSTLAAMAVPPERLEAVAALVSSFDEVNHNYQRAHPQWNLWFVVTAADETHLVDTLAEIARRANLDVLDVLDLRMVREHHIDLAFSLLEEGPARRRAPAQVDEVHQDARVAAPAALVAAIQDGVPLVERPFEELARRLEMDEDALLASLRALLAQGDLRRFGAVLNHRALGFVHNAMCVFEVDDREADTAGERLAELPFVTLCYRRRAAPPRWPYSLYCMIHGRSAADVQARAEEAARFAGLAHAPRAVLFSTRCFKQRGAHYARTNSARSAARVGAEAALDDTDRALVRVLQDGLPIDDRPFQAAAEATGLTEQDVVRRVAALLERRVLTRFGPMYDVERFGGHFTLVAMQVPNERFDEVASLVNAYPEVAHNYAREHALNMWFVLATETQARAQDVLREIEARTGLTTVDLPRERTFHLGLRLSL